MKTIPTEADWMGHPLARDEAYGHEHFFGKTLPEARALFVENALRYQEDIMFMPTPCFYFYAHAYIDYLMSEESRGDSDGASCFFGIAEIRASEISCAPDELQTRIRDLIRHLGEHQDWYDAEPEVYGSFRARAEA
ncbi:MAG: hypothetical protein U1G05_16370, partial [Kiritimatiellia bacterium]